MARITAPTTIGINPLDGLVPLSPTLAAVQPKRATAGKAEPGRSVALTFNLSPALVARLQGVVGITPGLSLDAFAEEALGHHLGRAGGRSAAKARPAKRPKAPKAKEKRKR